MSEGAAPALHLAGIKALQQGLVPEALSLLEQATSADPTSAAAASDFGLALTVAQRYDDAVASLRRALELKPGLAEAALNLGNIHRHRGELNEAVACYYEAIASRPDLPQVHNNLAVTLLHLGRPADAERYSRDAIAINASFAEAHLTLGAILDALGRPEEAIESHRRALALKPNSATGHAELAKTLAGYGRLTEAAESYRRAVELRPGKASWRRALSRIVPSDEAQIAADETTLADPAMPEAERAQLGFKLGKAYEDRGDYEHAFTRLSEANAIVRRGLDYDRAASEAVFADVKATFTPELFAKHAGAGSDDETPIFVLGMPRSSTTLVEQILASHPQVFGAGELPLLNSIAARLGTAGKPPVFTDALATLNDESLTALGRDYATALRAYSATARFITDKMPGNFLLIGLIKLILPRAKVIHCTRDPADTAMSIYRNYFAGRLSYAYDLAEIGHYYRLYQDLMVHWRKVLPGFVYDIDYETLILEQEQETRRLIAHCGLEWDARCLDFAHAPRPVHTASWAQVREGMFDRSVGVAEKYGDRLKPLHDALAGRV